MARQEKFLARLRPGSGGLEFLDLVVWSCYPIGKLVFSAPGLEVVLDPTRELITPPGMDQPRSSLEIHCMSGATVDALKGQCRFLVRE